MGFIYESVSLGGKASLNRFVRLLLPLLDEILSPEIERKIELKENELYLQGYSLGDYRELKNFSVKKEKNQMFYNCGENRYCILFDVDLFAEEWQYSKKIDQIVKL